MSAQSERDATVFTCQKLDELFDEADAPHEDFRLVQERCETALDYMSAFVDHVPRNLREAMRSFELAVDKLGMTEVEPILVLTGSQGKTLEGLIELRRLERTEAASDHCPDAYGARVLRSLIAWMGRPALLP